MLCLTGSDPKAAKLASFVVFALSLALYFATAARTVTLVDSGELIVAAATLGVAHPPGFPVWTLLGHAFSLLPLGSVAFRVTLLSAVSAAIAAALATAVSRVLGAARATETAGGRKRRAAQPPTPAVAPSLAVATGLVVATERTFWFYATVAEVYTLTAALLLGSGLALLEWRRRRREEELRSHRLLIAAGALLGLALGTHHVTAILVLPGMLLFAIRVGGWRSPGLRRAALAAIALAMAAYAYLPLAASRDPVLAWGDPRHLHTFWWHVTGKWYQENLFQTSLQRMAENLAALPALLWQELGPVLLLSGVGALWLWRRDRVVCVAALLSCVCNVVYGIKYEIAEDSDAYFLPLFVALAIAAGLGFHALAAKSARRALAVAVSAVVGLAVWHHRGADRSQDRVAHDFVTDALAGVAPGGLLLTLDWQLYSPWLYRNHVEGFRDDATVVDVNLMRRTWYLERYLKQEYPEMMAACAVPGAAFTASLRDWELGRPHDPADLTRKFVALIDAMIAFHLPDREAHVTVPMERGVGAGLRWVPHGLTLRVGPPGATSASLHVEGLNSVHLEPVAVTKVRPYYARMLVLRARYLASLGDKESALGNLAGAEKLEPASAEVRKARMEIADGALELGNAAPP